MPLKQRNHSGNVLFLILIAVALFAALSYAVTSSSKSGGGGVSKDKAKIVSAEIIQYATSIQQAITRMMLMNGCSDTQISFENAGVAGYVNASAPADSRCHVFHPNGGGISFVNPEEKWQDTTLASSLGGVVGQYYMTAKICLPGVGSGKLPTCWSNGQDDTELLFVLPWVSEELCTALNKGSGIESLPTAQTFLQFDRAFGSKFTGSFTTGIKRSAGGHPQMQNKHSYCFFDSTSSSPGDGYHYYHVLIAR